MIRSPAGALSRWSFISVLPLLIVTMVVAADARGQAAAPPPAPPPAPGTPAAATPASPTPAPSPGTPGAAPAIGTIPANVKSLNTAAALTPPIRDGIQTFISGAVGQLAGTSASQQTRARSALINEAMVNGLPNASAAYLDVYATFLNQQLLPLANHESPRVRLNAAIVTAEVARIANNIHLAPTAQAFLNDKSDAIVLWAMKAAHGIIPAQLAFPGQFNKGLADAIVPTVMKHSQGQVAGAIALEAYLALTIDIWDPARQVAPAHLTTMSPYVLQLLQERLKLYVKGVPPAARAESYGTGFITSPKVWNVLTPPQQLAAMQAMVNLISLAGAQVQAANPGDRYDLVLSIQRAASGASTVAPAAAEALKLATGLNPKDATPKQVADAVAPILPAVKAVPQFAAISNPPPIQGNEPAPPPASAPTTGNVLIPGASTQPTTGAPPGVGVPPGTTPTGPGAAHPPAPKTPAPKAGDGAGTGTGGGTAPKTPGGTQSPRPTAPGGGGAAPKTGAGAPGTGAGTGAGGTTPPTPAR